jgi:hypothetical protein
MQLVLIIKHGGYLKPFSIHKGSSVACTFADALENHPFFPKQPLKNKRNKRQISTTK